MWQQGARWGTSDQQLQQPWAPHVAAACSTLRAAGACCRCAAFLRWRGAKLRPPAAAQADFGFSVMA